MIGNIYLPMDTISIGIGMVVALTIDIVPRADIIMHNREDMPPHPIKEKLDRIITKYFARKLSYSQAKHEIEEVVDEEVERIENDKVSKKNTYKTIVSLGEAKKNALDRLTRKKKELQVMRSKLKNRRF